MTGLGAHVYDLESHSGFLLAEEDALKKFFSGMSVPMKGGKTKDVPVYFRWPESERSIAYPFITLDLLSISPAYDRWHSTFNQLSTPAEFEWVDENGTRQNRFGHYYPSVTHDINTLDTVKDVEEDPGEVTGYHAENYHPFNLMYQVSTWTRSIQHDRVLTGKMFIDLVSPRSFFIGVEADHTWRRAELLEWIPGDTLETTESAKRTFRKIYTINMEAEIPTSQVHELVKVGRVHADILSKDVDTPYPPGTLDHGDHSQVSGYFVEPPP